MIKLYIIHLDNKETFNDILNYTPQVSNDRKEKINKLKFTNDKSISILSELLMRYCIFDTYDLSSEEVSFRTNEFGKPYLASFQNIFFNVTHSEHYIACAISDSEIGIDIEFVSKDDCSFMNRILHPQELGWIDELNQFEKNNTYYKFWCLKEAFGKCLGVGLNYDTQGTYFSYENQNWNLKETSFEVNYEYHFCIIDSIKDYIMAICSPKNINIERIDLTVETLLKAFMIEK